jgi:hypothetical protein
VPVCAQVEQFHGPSLPKQGRDALHRAKKSIHITNALSSAAAPQQENHRRQRRLADVEDARHQARAFELSTEAAMQVRQRQRQRQTGRQTRAYSHLLFSSHIV